MDYIRKTQQDGKLVRREDYISIRKHVGPTELFIEKAITQAKYAYKKGNFPIGAILLVDDATEVSGQNKVVSKKDPVYHAEIDIIHRASVYKDTLNKKLFVSMEPCGRCARALVEYGIDEVYYLLKDPAW